MEAPQEILRGFLYIGENCRVKLLPFVLLCTFTQSAPACLNAQTSPTIWKKRVARTINMAQTGARVNKNLPQETSDSLLVQMFVSAVKDGRLTAYKVGDNASFTEKLSPTDLDEPKGGCTGEDSIVLIDPASGNEYKKPRVRGIDWFALQKLDVLEEWSFEPETGKTKIEIVGVGPTRDIYRDDSVFLGRQTLFWLKYPNALKIITKYERSHPNNTVTNHIWSDYFLGINQFPFISANGILNLYCTRLVELDRRSDSSNYLKEYNEYSLSSFFDLLYKPALDKKLKVYSHCCDTLKQVRPEFGDDYISADDTVTVVDPITGEEVRRIRIACDPATNSFLIVEKWQMDAKSGRTDVNIISLTPVKKHHWSESPNSYSRPLFWMRYTDYKPMIARYEQYNPLNSLSEAIWNNYFLSDTKPSPVK